MSLPIIFLLLYAFSNLSIIYERRNGIHKFAIDIITTKLLDFSLCYLAISPIYNRSHLSNITRIISYKLINLHILFVTTIRHIYLKHVSRQNAIRMCMCPWITLQGNILTIAVALLEIDLWNQINEYIRYNYENYEYTFHQTPSFILLVLFSSFFWWNWLIRRNSLFQFIYFSSQLMFTGLLLPR